MISRVHMCATDLLELQTWVMKAWCSWLGWWCVHWLLTTGPVVR